jgi:hypothetical protein
MGTWGTGNFQNDGALDYLGELTDHFAKYIDDILLSESGADADEDGESRLVPTVAILDLLCERFDSAPPKLEKVAEWRERYLAAFDRSMPGLDADGSFMKERRPIVERTFAALEARSKQFWSR